MEADREEVSLELNEIQKQTVSSNNTRAALYLLESLQRVSASCSQAAHSTYGAQTKPEEVENVLRVM